VSFLSQPITLIPTQPKRTIGPITMQVVIEERTTDTLTVTKQPVQQGASITDNAYLEPTVFTSTAYFKDNTFSINGVLNSFTSPQTGLAKLYQQLLDLQSSFTPFNIVTPKRVYQNMLMTTLTQTTDKNTENILAVTMSFQQVIIVSVSTAAVPRTSQSNPATTGATQNAGTKQSALYTGAQAITGLFK
jgi:hypothetical protein